MPLGPPGAVEVLQSRGFALCADARRMQLPPTGWHWAVAGDAPSVCGDVRLVERDVLAARLGVPHETDDTALVLASWRRWGRDCPRHLTGAFAFMIWDPAERLLFGARDPLGIKPFFYDLDGSRIVAADCLERLLAAHADGPGLDECAVATYLAKPFTYDGWVSLRRRIALLRPGHSLCFDANGLRLERHARLADAPDVRFARAGDYDEALRDVLERAVADAAEGDGQLGVHLSGGLDSAAIAALATRSAGGALAYCWQPMAMVGTDESEDQRLVRTLAATLDLQLRAVPLEPADVLAHVALDPCGRSITGTLLMEAPVQRAARAEGVTTILSGHGGDQGLSFAGWGCEVGFGKSLRRLVRPLLGPLATQDEAWQRGRRLDYLAAPFREALRRVEPPPLASTARGQQIALLEDDGLCERIVSWDWAGKRMGLDYRYPLLDIRLIRLVLGLPPGMFAPGSQGRALARRLLRPLLPDPVVHYADKTDMVRIASVRRAAVAAFAQLLPRLDRATPERAQFVDMPRLSHDVRRLIETGEGPIGLLLRTLAFLNLGE